jgi:hypothetical protein
MEPVLRGDSADFVAALSRYFGGAPRAASARAGAVKANVEQASATDEFGETGRRGC